MKLQLPKELRPVSVYSSPKKPRWVFNFDWSNSHYTATINLKDRHFNIHKTFETKGSSHKRYQHIVTVNFFTLGRILVLLNKKLPSLYQKYYRYHLNNSDLAKHHDFLLPLECNQGHVSDLFTYKRNKVKLAKEFNLPDIEDMLIDSKDILLCESKAFMTMKITNKKLVWTGMVTKIQADEKTKLLLFISLEDQQRFLHEYMEVSYSILDQVHFKGKTKILKSFNEVLVKAEDTTFTNMAS